MAWRLPSISSGHGKAKLSPFHPFVPTPNVIPPGLYDPTIDANLAAAGRGFNDLVQSTATQNQRDVTDYGLGQQNISQQFTRGSEDIAAQQQAAQQGQDYTAADIATAQGREGQDYATSIANLDRRYQQQAGVQRQEGAQYGVLRGGYALQAAQKRAANQALDQAPINTAHSRALEDFQTRLDRLGAEKQTTADAITRDTTRLGENRDTALGKLALDMAPPDAANPLGGRSFQDRTTALLQGARELGFSGIDTQRQRVFSAGQAGYNPPELPANEHYNPITGKTTRTVTRGNMVYVIDPSGRVLSSRRRS